MDYKNIESAKYTFENESIFCVIGGANPVSVTVPMATDNTDYIEIMRQVDAGELTIEPADGE
jgi:hypothetical protein